MAPTGVTVTSTGSSSIATTTGSGGASSGPTTTTGSGGSGGGAGQTGSGGGFPGCIPGQSIGCACTDGRSGAQVCRADGTYGNCVCTESDAGTWEQQQLARLRRGIVGTWSGTESNPWESSCDTKMVFEANGHYSAHSPGDECVVFFYGSNDDTPEKTYVLNDVLATAEGSGEIVFWFSPGDTNAGVLRHLVLSEDENKLSFEAWKGMYGPLMFSLTRVSR